MKLSLALRIESIGSIHFCVPSVLCSICKLSCCQIMLFTGGNGIAFMCFM